MDKINIYEYSGIVCPGTILLVGLVVLCPEYMQYFTDMSIGAFGVILILSFCTGHILSAIGNIIEDLIYSPKQWTDYKLKKYKTTGVVAYATLREKGKTARIDVFNRLYGLMRGMFIAFTSLGVLSIAIKTSILTTIILFVLSAFSLYRALHFAYLYTNSLIINWQLFIKKINSKK